MLGLLFLVFTLLEFFLRFDLQATTTVVDSRRSQAINAVGAVLVRLDRCMTHSW